MKITTFLLAILIPAFSSAAEFTLLSSSLEKNKPMPTKHVFNGMGCSGENLSPQLEWKNAPIDTKSFAVTAYDPDAPTGSGWWHWTLYNIPASVTKIEEGASGSKAKLPKGAIEGRTDFGTKKYGGACPPAGDKAHRYIFTVYALKADNLDLPVDASAAMLGFYLTQNTLDKASFTVEYAR